MLHAFVEYLKAGDPPHWQQLVALVVYAHLEWILPRLKVVKANSALEAIANAAKPALRRIPLVSRAVAVMASPEPKPAIAPIEGEDK